MITYFLLKYVYIEFRHTRAQLGEMSCLLHRLNLLDVGTTYVRSKFKCVRVCGFESEGEGDTEQVNDIGSAS